MKPKIRNTYRKSPDGDLANLAYRITESLKENPHFPTPTPALAAIETALQEYRDALVKASTRNQAMVSIKNEKRAKLQSLLTELANYVTEASRDNLSVLLTSGFDLVRQKGDLVLPAIDRFVVEIGPPGEAITQVKSIAGARAYVHQYTTEPEKGEAAWVSVTSADRRHRFTHLAPAVRHWFRVMAIGVNQQSVISSTVSRIIQ